MRTFDELFEMHSEHFLRENKLMEIMTVFGPFYVQLAWTKVKLTR